jgi:ArsR family transcriptional regulator, arsenate/arsenite/antimonite-responsive transcriptional repressor
LYIRLNGLIDERNICMEQLVQMYKALSEDMRLRIMMLLIQGELCVCDLMTIFEQPQSKVSRHLAYLKHSGLIQGKRVGTWMHYSIKEPLDITIDAQLAFMKQQFGRLPVFLEDIRRLEDVKKQKLCDNSSPDPTCND